jgi:hypothetical protein
MYNMGMKLMEPKTIGQLLRDIHIRQINEQNRTLNQNELAAWFGIDSGLFNKYYNDRRSPEGENLEKLARKAGPVVYKLTGQVPPRIAKQISDIPPDRLADLEKVIDEFMRDLLGLSQ